MAGEGVDVWMHECRGIYRFDQIWATRHAPPAERYLLVEATAAAATSWEKDAGLLET